MFKKSITLGILVAFLGQGVAISAESVEKPDENLDKQTIEMKISEVQSIQASDVIQVENEFGTYLMVKIHPTENKDVTHDSTIDNKYLARLTTEEFNRAKELIDIEMTDVGYIVDTVHEKNGVGGYIRRLISDEFYTQKDTMRSHQEKSQQLLNYMDITYDRYEEIEKESSTIKYTKTKEEENIAESEIPDEEIDSHEKEDFDIVGSIMNIPRTVKNRTERALFQVNELYKMYQEEKGRE